MLDYIKIKKLVRYKFDTIECFANQLKLSRSITSKIINGKRKISAEELKLMADLLHVNIEELYIKTD